MVYTFIKADNTAAAVNKLPTLKKQNFDEV